MPVKLLILPSKRPGQSIALATALWGALLLNLLLSALPALADDAKRTPTQWLELMNKAFSDLNYDGTFSYYNGANLETLRVVHMVSDGVEKERLVHLNGALREITRVGDEISCVMEPGDALVAFERSFPSGPFGHAFTVDLNNINNHYTVSRDRDERVADRKAVRLSITPEDAYRYGYRLWVDAATGLLLRSELLDARDGKLEMFQFTRLEIGPSVTAAALRSEVPKGAIVTHLRLNRPDTEQHAAPPELPWQVGWVPDGFTMASWDNRHMDDQKGVNTLMYSDGLAAISIFVERAPSTGTHNLVTRSGATVAVTSRVNGPDNEDHLVTVVGEVPAATAKRVAKSVRYRQLQ